MEFNICHHGLTRADFFLTSDVSLSSLYTHYVTVSGASGEDSRCSPLPQFSLVTRGDCQTRYHVATAECSGSCGEDMNLCCQPSGTTTVQAKLTCADGPAQFVDVSNLFSLYACI